MFVFHFSFDLNYFGVVSIQFLEDPFWLNFRRFIVSLFLLLVGISLHLATRKGIRWQSWSRRMALLLVYAGLVSLGSWMMFPETFIYFGILHFIALASILGLLFTRLYWVNLLLGIFIILLDINYSNALFNAPYLQWFGLMPHLPTTEDYVPLLPWFGVVLIGMFIGKTLFDDDPMGWLSWNSQQPVVRWLAFGGRHSIHIYMLHQPVFIGLLSLWFWIAR
ncbi:MAG: DUF1624 domain-containing protein [Gammaproteobacteria bacterium]|nr:DUF1624 domain-containing protein [Gammaproteobacteria bacterium]